MLYNLPSAITIFTLFAFKLFNLLKDWSYLRSTLCYVYVLTTLLFSQMNSSHRHLYSLNISRSFLSWHEIYCKSLKCKFIHFLKKIIILLVLFDWKRIDDCHFNLTCCVFTESTSFDMKASWFRMWHRVSIQLVCICFCFAITVLVQICDYVFLVVYMIVKELSYFCNYKIKM